MSVKKRKLVLALAVIFAVNILAIALAQSALAGVYKKGSSGAMVSQIQTRLKSWGYYSGAVDGVYGSATEKAVRYCWPDLYPPRPEASRISARWPWARWCSTESSTPHSPTAFPA